MHFSAFIVTVIAAVKNGDASVDDAYISCIWTSQIPVGS